jgi:hypothetical protein
VFDNRVLRKTFEPKKNDVMGEWRRLHSGQLHNFYSSPNIIRQIKARRMNWAGHMARMGEGRKVYEVLVGKPERNRLLSRPRHRREDEIRMTIVKI